MSKQVSSISSPEQQAKAKLKFWATNPKAYVTEALGCDPQPWQIEALDSICAHDRVAIRSGHGVGKSAFLSWLILWWLCTRFPAKIACTAPTSHQLQDILWAELAKWHRRLKERMPQLAENFDWKTERFELRGGENESFAVARTARKETPEAFQGFHSENMLFVIDEASGVDDLIFEVGQGSMSTAGAKTVMAGNPTRTSGFFYDAFHKMRDRWHTIRVNGEESALVSQDYVRNAEAQWGRDSNIFRVRVLGEFPLSEDDVVIPLHLVESAIGREVAPTQTFRPVWGVDVARYGDDRTALAKRGGNSLIEPTKSWRGKDTMQVAGIVAREFNATPSKQRPSEILVDVIGLGAGVVDRLSELGLPVRGINVAESAAIGERYMRLRDELWFRARDWFAAANVVMPKDDGLIAELVGPKYGIASSGKIKVESKDEMKKRGVRSPDLADAFILTFAGGLDVNVDYVPDAYSKDNDWRPGGWMSA